VVVELIMVDSDVDDQETWEDDAMTSGTKHNHTLLVGNLNVTVKLEPY
jgi:hypothetical protein